jgi:hypothetical protein
MPLTRRTIDTAGKSDDLVSRTASSLFHAPFRRNDRQNLVFD